MERKKHPLESLAEIIKENKLSIHDSTQLQYAVSLLDDEQMNNLQRLINKQEGGDRYERANNAFKQLIKFL